MQSLSLKEQLALRGPGKGGVRPKGKAQLGGRRASWGIKEMTSLSFSLSLAVAHRALRLPAVIAEGYLCSGPPDLACVFDNRVIPLDSGRRSASGLFLGFLRVFGFLLMEHLQQTLLCFKRTTLVSLWTACKILNSLRLLFS